MYILGLTAFTHDSSVCLLKDGQVVGFIEEERLNREKHTQAFPFLSFQKLMEMEGIGLSEISKICYYSRPWDAILENGFHFISHFPKSLNLFSAHRGSTGSSFLSEVWCQLNLRKLIEARWNVSYTGEIEYYDHHLSHAASAFFPSPFKRSAILSLDGRGEAQTTLFAVGCGTHIEPLAGVKVPHSLGHFYAAITDYLGFRHFNEEWKVMGLSAYGKPSFVSDFMTLIDLYPMGYRLNLEYFDFPTHGQSRWLSEIFFEKFGPPRDPLEEITQRHMDIAFAAQYLVEETALKLTGDLHKTTGEENLCLAGGVAFNCLMNSRVINESPFKNIFIQPIAGDAGTSLGAACLGWFKAVPQSKRYPMNQVYWGPEYSDLQIEQCLQVHGLKYSRSTCVAAETAKIIAQGGVVCWFQGRMEAGPRALGHRSILADPRRKDMKEIINSKIKKREFFRPFAPSVLENYADEYFSIPGDSAPYMVTVAKVRANKRDTIPAVTHVDGTARVQVVSEKVSPDYYELLEEFNKLTQVPVLLNTSFNENEPIVCTPDEAIDCFQRTGLDALAIGSFLVERLG